MGSEWAHPRSSLFTLACLRALFAPRSTQKLKSLRECRCPGGLGRPVPGLRRRGWVGRSGEKGRGRGPDCYRRCHSNRVTWRLGQSRGAGGGVYPGSTLGVGLRFPPDPRTSGPSHRRPSLFKHPPPHLFPHLYFKDGETEAQGAGPGSTDRTRSRVRLGGPTCPLLGFVEVSDTRRPSWKPPEGVPR